MLITRTATAMLAADPRYERTRQDRAGAQNEVPGTVASSAGLARPDRRRWR